MRLPNFLQGMFGPYSQSAKKDLWLPVKGAAVAVLIRCIPILAVSAEAVLIGRAFGPVALALVVAAEAVNANSEPQDRIPTFWCWVAGLTFTFVWAFDAWPIPARWVAFRLLQSAMTMPGQTAGRYYVMWSFAGRAFEPMGALLFWRLAAIIALPFALPEPWAALNWRTLVEIVAPTLANSILYKDVKPTPAPEAAPVRATSAPVEGRRPASLF